MNMADHTAQEEIISACGDAELLWKRGRKIVRYKKKTWGREDDEERYASVEFAIRGDVLNVGMGAGNSVNMMLPRSNSVVAYETEQDLIDLYVQTFGTNEKLTIVNADAFENKPEGSFDVIFYEIEIYSQETFDRSTSYLEWGISHLKEGGIIILPYNTETKTLSESFLSSCNITTIERGSGLGKSRVFIILSKR